MTYFHDIAHALAAVSHESLTPMTRALWATSQRDGMIFVCGNGGNAATASHFVCDLMKLTIEPGERRVRALAVTDNTALMTAWGNDAGYDRVFVEQLASLGRPGDTLVALSASGNSPNVLHATRWATAHGLDTIGISGQGGGKLAALAALPFVIPSFSMQVIEDMQSIICHALALAVAEQVRAQ